MRPARGYSIRMAKRGNMCCTQDFCTAAAHIHHRRDSMGGSPRSPREPDSGGTRKKKMEGIQAKSGRREITSNAVVLTFVQLTARLGDDDRHEPASTARECILVEVLFPRHCLLDRLLASLRWGRHIDIPRNVHEDLHTLRYAECPRNHRGHSISLGGLIVRDFAYGGLQRGGLDAKPRFRREVDSDRRSSVHSLSGLRGIRRRRRRTACSRMPSKQ